MGVGYFVLAVVAGGLLAGTIDVVAPSLTMGTPLGPESRVSPVAWTAIAAVGMVGIREVLD
jgi:hypothetical protein